MFRKEPCSTLGDLVARLSHRSILCRRLGRLIYNYTCFSFILLKVLTDAIVNTTEVLCATHFFTDFIP